MIPKMRNGAARTTRPPSPQARPSKPSPSHDLASVQNCLTAALAERVMGWRAAPDRFLKSGRVWIPRWRFQPFSNVEDALTLLDAAQPTEYSIRSKVDGQVEVRVSVHGHLGVAIAGTRSAAISVAVARAIGLEVAL